LRGPDSGARRGLLVQAGFSLNHWAAVVIFVVVTEGIPPSRNGIDSGRMARRCRKNINVSDVKLTRASFNNGVTVSVRGHRSACQIPTMLRQYCLDVAAAQYASDYEAVGQDQNLVAMGINDRHGLLEQPLQGVFNAVARIDPATSENRSMREIFAHPPGARNPQAEFPLPSQDRLRHRKREFPGTFCC
jgi:hypothetical protein